MVRGLCSNFSLNFDTLDLTGFTNKMLATDVFDAFADVGFEDKKKLLDVGLK